MPQDRSLRMGVLALALIVFGVFIYCGAQAGGKKEPPRPLPPAPRVVDAEDLPLTPPLPPPPSAPMTPPVPPAVQNSIWTFGFEIKEGRTLLTAKVKSREFKVSCDSVDMQTPRGQVIAQGKVRIEGPQLEAMGEKLTIHFGDEQFHLEGKAQVKCGANMEVELAGERLSLKAVGAARLGSGEKSKEPIAPEKGDDLPAEPKTEEASEPGPAPRPLPPVPSPAGEIGKKQAPSVVEVKMKQAFPDGEFFSAPIRLWWPSKRLLIVGESFRLGDDGRIKLSWCAFARFPEKAHADAAPTTIRCESACLELDRPISSLCLFALGTRKIVSVELAGGVNLSFAE